MGSLSLLCAQLEEQLRAVAASESEGAAQDDSKSSDKAMVEAEETTTCEHAVAQGASLQAMSGPCHDGESTLRAHEEPGGEKEEAASSTERCSAAAAPKTTTSKAGSSTAAATLTVAPNVPTAATEAADGVAPTEEPAALKERESRELEELKREMVRGVASARAVLTNGVNQKISKSRLRLDASTHERPLRAYLILQPVEKCTARAHSPLSREWPCRPVCACGVDEPATTRVRACNCGDSRAARAARPRAQRAHPGARVRRLALA
eukprot:2118297-Pleurochrysis_carterae.AAC.2